MFNGDNVYILSSVHSTKNITQRTSFRTEVSRKLGI